MDRRDFLQQACRLADRSTPGLALWALGSIAAAGLGYALLPQPAEGQVQTPAVLAAACSACHGPGGVSPGEIPSIEKLSGTDMAARLRAFKSGAAEATVMNRIARGFTDAQIDQLAQYLGTQQR